MLSDFPHHGPGKPNVHMGAVYFRKSAPPVYDWERDYQMAHEDGCNIFRHWFPWGAIEVAPGVYDWTDFDVQLDLAAQNHIDTVIAEMITLSPEWLYHKYPHARVEMRDGHQRVSEMGVSCITGGSHCMCLDNPEVSTAAGEFLRQLALRYKDHPGLFGYDVWNECSKYNPNQLCYCPATQQKFREWLKKKYGSLEALAKAWLRFSYTDWSEVYLPRQVASYPDVLDSIQFFNDNAIEWLKWRVDILKSVDSKHPVIAHGNGKTFSDIPVAGDDWRSADQVDIFGYTYWWSNRCHPLLCGDMIRAASDGKEFWRAEAVGNSEWTDRKPGDRYKYEKDYMSEPEEIRLDAMISFVAGARGYMNPRWRPMLNGPLFGAYGWYGLDGSRTERSAIVSAIAKWANSPDADALWQATPLKGDLAILLLEDPQAWCYAYYGDTELYSLSLQGAYEAFMHSNIQADFARMDQIGRYDVLYVPYPVALSDATVEALTGWVKQGGTLISEAGFGFLNDRGRAQEKQPSRGLDEVFGCMQAGEMSFAPDRWDTLIFTTVHGAVCGGLYRQALTPTTGTVVAWYDNGEIAGVANNFGKGRALLVGTMPGYGYKKTQNDPTRKWFADLLAWAGRMPMVRVNRPAGVIGRLWQSAQGMFLWVVNQNKSATTVTLTVRPDLIEFSKATAIRGEPAQCGNNSLTVKVAGRDAAVLALG